MHKKWLFLLLIPLLYFMIVGINWNQINYNTTVYGIKVGGMTPSEAFDHTQEQLNTQFLAVKEQDVVYDVPLKELVTLTNPDYFGELQTRQNKWLWWSGDRVEPDGVIQLKDDIDWNTLLGNHDRQASVNARIGDDLHLVPAFYGNELDTASLNEAVLSFEPIDVREHYIEPSIIEESEALQAKLRHLEAILDGSYTLTLPDGLTAEIPQETVEKALYYDEGLMVDLTYLEEWLIGVNDMYMPYEKPFIFESTRQGVVEVPGGTLGWAIDRPQTAQRIADGLLNDESSITAAVVGDGYNINKADGTYIEVDLTTQEMFYYENGQLFLETPIVSGMSIASPPTPTIPGAYEIWNAESPSVLVGTNMQYGNDYQQPVDYWLAFDDTGQGIHDANWQGAFGGDMYLYSGSQGCINTPPGVMAELYAMVSVGTPVMVVE